MLYYKTVYQHGKNVFYFFYTIAQKIYNYPSRLATRCKPDSKPISVLDSQMLCYKQLYQHEWELRKPVIIWKDDAHRSEYFHKISSFPSFRAAKIWKYFKCVLSWSIWLITELNYAHAVLCSKKIFNVLTSDVATFAGSAIYILCIFSNNFATKRDIPLQSTNQTMCSCFFKKIKNNFQYPLSLWAQQNS